MKNSDIVLLIVTALVMVIATIPFATFRFLKSSTKVDTAVATTKILYYTFFAMSVTSISSTVLGLTFLGVAYKSTFKLGVLVVSVILRAVWNTLLITLYYMAWRAS